MKYFTSDTHYGHKNIIQYSKRPFTSVEGMNETMISNWNSVVGKGDEIYHLGDFSFLPEKETANILRRLNGNKFLIYGNHDRVIQDSKELQSSFNWCRDYHELNLVDRKNVKIKAILCHYAFLVWNKSHHGSLMLHGHSHGSLRYPNKMRIMDVGVDPQGFFPISEHDVVAKLTAIEPPSFDHHGA